MDIRFLSTAGYDFYGYREITVTSGIDGGSIELEYGWQMIAIPVEYGYWDNVQHKHIHDNVTVAKFKNYVLDQIEDVYGTGNVEVANTYTGDQQAFYSYVVGSTPDGSPHNFNMVYVDGSNKEISGFWIKIVGGSGPYLITWGG